MFVLGANSGGRFVAEGKVDGQFYAKLDFIEEFLWGFDIAK